LYKLLIFVRNKTYCYYWLFLVLSNIFATVAPIVKLTTIFATAGTAASEQK